MIDSTTVPMREFLDCYDPRQNVLAKIEPLLPVGSVEPELLGVDYDVARDEYRVHWRARFPFGQLSLGL